MAMGWLIFTVNVTGFRITWNVYGSVFREVWGRKTFPKHGWLALSPSGCRPRMNKSCSSDKCQHSHCSASWCAQMSVDGSHCPAASCTHRPAFSNIVDWTLWAQRNISPPKSLLGRRLVTAMGNGSFSHQQKWGVFSIRSKVPVR